MQAFSCKVTAVSIGRSRGETGRDFLRQRILEVKNVIPLLTARNCRPAV